ncbi:hypothetical protein ACPZ19_44470 [Amycolatopsis lurida]
MISVLWRLLPGPRWVRFLAVTVVFAGISAMLWYWVFPMLPDLVPRDDPTVE